MRKCKKKTIQSLRSFLFILIVTQFAIGVVAQTKPSSGPDGKNNNFRKPQSKKEAEYWLRNMIVYHGFSDTEVAQATGWNQAEIDSYKSEFDISPKSKPGFPSDVLLILPYPGGRHPRIGFLEGAIEPQRETKFSAFLPWDRSSFVVLDIPEAIWSNLGLTYLAHTHIPTIFEDQGKKLKPLEWDRGELNQLSLTRTLPNKIVFTSKVVARKDHVQMSMSLTNGTKKKLSDLRVQNCVMLKSAKGYQTQSNENKRYIGPYVVCHDKTKSKWIITCWKPNHRPWANAPCPCLHSDPKFPDCNPGQTKKVFGWLSFYQGKNIDKEVDRIESLKWWK